MCFTEIFQKCLEKFFFFVNPPREFVGTNSGNLQSLMEHLYSHKSGVCRAWRLKSSSLGGVY